MIKDVAGQNLLIPLGAQVIDFNGLILLNETASCLWEYLHKETSVNELAELLADKFEVDYLFAIKDVEYFLEQLGTMGALEK